MVTPLNIGLLSNFKIIFPMIFIFAIVYGLLTKLKPFGENAILNAMIAIVLAIMSIFSELVVDTINMAAPWFVVLVIGIMFILIGFLLLGAKEGDAIELVKNPEFNFIGWTVAGLVIAIVLGSLAFNVSQKGGFPPYGTAGATEDGKIVDTEEVINLEGEEATGQVNDFWKTLFHPKILGMLAIMIIAFFTVSKLTARQ